MPGKARLSLNMSYISQLETQRDRGVCRAIRSPRGSSGKTDNTTCQTYAKVKTSDIDVPLRGLGSLLSLIPRFLGFLPDAFDFLLGVENLLPLGTHHIL
jgi:hypothetical protein